jgi:hypothetical protein
MDVSLWNLRAILFISLCLFLAALWGCGNRFDLSTDRGRRARIDEANFHLSRGECDAAIAAINPLYASVHVDTEVRVITASAHACRGGFNMLTMLGNMTGAANYFQAIAKSAGNNAGDGRISDFYNAIDILTESGAKMNANQRDSQTNTYMVFLQLGLVGAIMKNYGAPNISTGAQGVDMVYVANGSADVNEMPNTDACALTAAMSIASDSIGSSSLTDTDSTAFVNSFATVCGGSCSSVSKSRTDCDGTGADPDSVTAATVVTGINNAW